MLNRYTCIRLLLNQSAINEDLRLSGMLVRPEKLVVEVV